MTAQLRHKNIITVFDVGQQAGVLFIVMEYLDGQPLSQLMKRGKALGFGQRLAIVKQTCEALQYAHEKAIIHRDIKPGNIFICLDSGVKVLDFGIAALLQEPSALLTRGVGTPYYMSPEQILGSNLGPASDVWSIGVTLFELLRGRLPFVGGTSQAVFNEILSAQVPMTPPSLPFARALDQVFSYALAKQPEKRYSAASDMAADLDRLIPLVQQCESGALGDVADYHFDFNELTLDTLADRNSPISVHITVDPDKGAPDEKSPAPDLKGPEVAVRKAHERYASPVLGFRVSASRNVNLLKVARLPKTVQVLTRWSLPVMIAAALYFAYQSHLWRLQFFASFMTSLLAFIWAGLLVMVIERSALWLRSVPRCPGCRSRMNGCSEWVRYPKSSQENAILERDCVEALRVGAWEEATKLFTILGRTYQSNDRLRYQLAFYQCEACEEYAAKLAIYELRPRANLDSELWDQKSDATVAHMGAEKSQP
jgi:serine/threonine protein kinase